MKKHFHQFTFLEYKKVLSMNQEFFFYIFYLFLFQNLIFLKRVALNGLKTVKIKISINFLLLHFIHLCIYCINEFQLVE